MCTEFIGRHIRQLPPTKIFTTRELVRYGKRGAVDQALYRMVQCGFIHRLARGVFVKDPSGNPTKAQIAFAKARAWGKTLVLHAETILNDRGIERFGPFRDDYAVNAHTGSFDTIEGRVHLRGIGIRKFKLSATKVGQIVYALWHIGWDICDETHVAKASAHFNRCDKEEFLDASTWMPIWLNKLSRWRFPEPTISIPAD